MAVEKNIKKEITLIAPVKEIGVNDSYGIMVDQQTIKEMTEDDPDPRFVIVEIEEGKSKSNNIYYDEEFLQNIAKQINEKQPVGYLGHKHFQGLDKEDLLPDPQTVWVGATVVKEGGKAKLLAKGYNLPDSKIRKWIKTKAVNSVSWAGDAVLRPLPTGGYKVAEYFLESLDWSRKNREGVKNRVLKTVTEMEGDRKVTAEEIASLQLAELKEHNPGLVQTIENNAKATERAVALTEMEADKAKIEEAHQKEVLELPEVKELTKLRSFLKLNDDASVWEAVSALYEKAEVLAKGNITKWFDEKLKEIVPNEKARALVSRLVPITEMEGKTFLNDGDDIKKSLEDQAKDLVENDSDVTAVIKEMGSDRGGLRLSNHGGTRTDTNGTTGNDNKDDQLKETDNFTVETVAI
jgi:hypothetical protein